MQAPDLWCISLPSVYNLLWDQTCWRMCLLFGPRLRPGLLNLESAELQGMGLPILAHRQQAATTTDSITPPSKTACVLLLLVCPITSCKTAAWHPQRSQHVSGVDWEASPEAL